jgi:hypothetical protein
MEEVGVDEAEVLLEDSKIVKMGVMGVDVEVLEYCEL